MQTTPWENLSGGTAEIRTTVPRMTWTNPSFAEARLVQAGLPSLFHRISGTTELLRGPQSDRRKRTPGNGDDRRKPVVVGPVNGDQMSL